MLKIGITGNIASGKSTVEKLIMAKGYPVIDADIIAHELLESEFVKKSIVTRFGEELLEDGKISRKKLGQVVFADEIARKDLEKIIHPLVKEKIEDFFNQQEKNNEKLAFVSAPLLFEAKLENLFDKIILIYANDEIRLKRLIERNGLTKEQAQNRLNIQISQDKKISLADYVIYNNDSIDYLEKSTIEIIKLF